MADRRLAFIHIGKCAGTSVRSSLVNAFGRDNVCDKIFIKQYKDENLESLKLKYTVFSSHIGYDLAKLLSDNMVTVLRNPFDRVLSLYHYWKSLKSQGRDGPYFARSLDFAEFIECGARVVVEDIANTMTWQLACSHDWATRQKMRKQKIADDALLDLAKRNLKELRVVGFTDRIGEFYTAIGDWWGMTITEQAKVNVTEKRPKLDDVSINMKKKLYPRIYLDVDLYLFARTNFSRD